MATALVWYRFGVIHRYLRFRTIAGLPLFGARCQVQMTKDMPDLFSRNPLYRNSRQFQTLPTQERLPMIRARFTRILVASTLMLSGVCGIANAQTLVPGDQVLPKDTYMYFAVPSVDRMKQGFADSSTGKMWADPAFDDFKAEIKSAFSSELEEGLAQVQDVLGLTLDELLEIPQGEVSFALSATSGNKMGAVLIVDYGAHESEVSGLLQKAVAALSQVPDLESADTTINGTDVTLFKVTNPISRKTPLAKEFGWFLKDGRMVASNSTSVMDAILANWEGSSDASLQSNNVFSYVMEKCQSKADKNIIVAYFDPIGLVNKLVQTGSLGEAGMGAGMALGFLPTLGLSQVKAFGSVGQLDVDGFEGVSRSFIYTDQPPMGAMRIFMLDQVAPAPPSWVKEGASMYMTTKWKINDAYEAVESLVDMFQGPGALASIVDDLATKGPQVHIKTDVIDQLDGTVQMVSAPGDSASDTPGDQMLFALGVRDSSTMSDLLTKLTSDPGFPGESREFQGVTLYEIMIPGGQAISFTVANNQLMIGVGGTLVEQALRNDNDIRPLAETESYQKIAEHFQPGALAVTYTHPAAQYKSLYDLLKSGNAADNFPGMDEIFERIDFTRLPSFDVIEKYMAPAGGSWVGDDNGVLMEQFSLKPSN